jgi:hypothetical protein
MRRTINKQPDRLGVHRQFHHWLGRHSSHPASFRKSFVIKCQGASAALRSGITLSERFSILKMEFVVYAEDHIGIEMCLDKEVGEKLPWIATPHSSKVKSVLRTNSCSDLTSSSIRNLRCGFGVRKGKDNCVGEFSLLELRHRDAVLQMRQPSLYQGSGQNKRNDWKTIRFSAIKACPDHAGEYRC